MDDERKNSIHSGSNVKVNFGTLCIRPCGHNTDYNFSQSLSNFTRRLWIMRGGPLLILVIGQGELCPPARGCQALRCLVNYAIGKTCGYFHQGQYKVLSNDQEFRPTRLWLSQIGRVGIYSSVPQSEYTANSILECIRGFYFMQQ